MQTWTYPSRDFPAATSVSLTTPDGWSSVDAPGVVLAVSEPEGAGFRSNVVVNVTPQSEDFTLDSAAGELDLAIDGLEDPHVVTDGSLPLGDLAARVKEVVYAEPGVGTLVQSHLLTLAVRPRGLALVHATATCGADRGSEHIDALRSILSSIRLEE